MIVSIDLHCPKCGMYELEQEELGTDVDLRVKCNNCKTVFVVPLIELFEEKEEENENGEVR